jgi:hypothetical protein
MDPGPRRYQEQKEEQQEEGSEDASEVDFLMFRTVTDMLRGSNAFCS